jgi:hypothetical protein
VQKGDQSDCRPRLSSTRLKTYLLSDVKSTQRMSIRASGERIVARNHLKLFDIRVLCFSTNNEAMIWNDLMVAEDVIHSVVQAIVENLNLIAFHTARPCLQVFNKQKVSQMLPQDDCEGNADTRTPRDSFRL